MIEQRFINTGKPQGGPKLIVLGRPKLPSLIDLWVDPRIHKSAGYYSAYECSHSSNCIHSMIWLINTDDCYTSSLN